MNSKAKILVAGTGPTGLSAALALAKAGFQVVVAGPSPSFSDQRTTALMRPAISFLEELGISKALGEDIAAPLTTMRIIDATQRLVRGRTVTFRAAEIGEEFFGLNIPNAQLNKALADAVEACDVIVWHRQIVKEWMAGKD